MSKKEKIFDEENSLSLREFIDNVTKNSEEYDSFDRKKGNNSGINTESCQKTKQF